MNYAALRRHQDIYCLVSVVGTLANTRLALLSERAVEVEGSADEGQVREDLWEVSQRLAAGSDLLRIETEMVGVAKHLLEEEAGLFELPSAGERFD